MDRLDHLATLIPSAFAADIGTRPGAGAWLSALPDLIDGLLAEWELVVDGAVRHGYVGMVIPVRSAADAHAWALKVSQPSTEVDNQIAALQAWNGRGMVRLETADAARGALLLERLDTNRSLDDLDLPDAADIAAKVLRRGTVPAAAIVAARPVGLPHLEDHVRDWPQRWVGEWEALGRPLPRRWLEAAGDRCRLLGPMSGKLLVNHDLHYRNILAGTREPWLAVDPRGVVGDPEFALGPLLWNRFQDRADLADRVHRFIDIGDLDRDKATGWALVRAVDYFLWSTKAGLTCDPAACHEIIDWLNSR